MVTGDMATLMLAGMVQGCWLPKTTHVLRQKVQVLTHGVETLGFDSRFR